MRISPLLFLAALLLPLTALAQSGTTVTRTVTSKQTTYALLRCESPGGLSSFCPADTRRGVRMSNNLNGRCQIGRTWGYTARGIWVSGGCRGEFEIGRLGEGYGYGWGYASQQHVVCASDNFRRAFCPIATARGVRLVNQISESPCVRGRTWWRDARGIVVTDGCAGEFEVGYREADYVTPPAVGAGEPYRPDSIVCRSQANRRRFCPADIGMGGAQLVRQVGTNRCVYGRNWAYDPRGVWVSGGCGAEFQIGYTNAELELSDDERWVRCESREWARVECAAPGNRGVTLARQISRAPCVKGDSWDFDRRRIWVSEGCAADFEIRN